MIDIHCHILFGVDDGPKTLEESLQLARGAVKEGVSTIIATPHHKNGEYENNREDILKKTAKLNEILQKEKLPLVILPGQETRIHGEFLQAYENGELLTLNDQHKYIFVELPFGHVPRYTEQLLFEIELKGLVPIIVHPERNQGFMERPDLLYSLVKRGALTQVTAASVTGSFGGKIGKFTHEIIEANLTHFISSDAHNMKTRSLKMNKAYETIQQKYGSDTVCTFKENAALLVDGQNVIKDAPQRVKKKRLFGIF